MSISIHTWLSLFQAEYLRTYVPGGGSTVKVLVPRNDDDIQSLIEAISIASDSDEITPFRISATKVQVQYVDRLFFALAKATDWDMLASQFLRRVLVEAGYSTPVDRLELASLAASNQRDLGLLRQEINRHLERTIFRDYGMAFEFRLAMMHLCLAQLDPANATQLAEAVKEWLRGDLRLVSALKQALIFQKITRANGRHILASYLHWRRLTGARGTMLLIDISALAVATRHAADEDFFYSLAAVMDTYEVLRQFIDAMEEIESCAVVVLTSASFLTDTRRGVNCYDALRLRLIDDVRDRTHQNPLAPLLLLD